MGIFRNRFFLVALVLLLAAGGSSGFFVQQVFSAQAAYQEERERVAELQERARRADALEARWETVQEDAQKIGKAILQREDLPVFFETIEATARAAGVSETTTIQEEGKNEMHFLLRATGQFPNLYVFVTHLNVLPTLLFLEEVSFSSKGSSAGSRRDAQVVIEPSADVLVRVPLGGIVEKEDAGGSTEINTNDNGDVTD